MRSCRVDVRAGAHSRLLATGRANSTTGTRRLRVTLHLTSRARRTLAHALGGIHVTLHARAGKLRAHRSLRLLAHTNRINPPGGMFGPNSPTLTPTGRHFLRTIQARVRNVGTVRCAGHTAKIPGGEAAPPSPSNAHAPRAATSAASACTPPTAPSASATAIRGRPTPPKPAAPATAASTSPSPTTAHADRGDRTRDSAAASREAAAAISHRLVPPPVSTCGRRWSPAPAGDRA
jgi:hypothetical protein